MTHKSQARKGDYMKERRRLEPLQNMVLESLAIIHDVKGHVIYSL